MYAVYNSQDNRTHSSIFGHAGRGRCDAARKCKGQLWHRSQEMEWHKALAMQTTEATMTTGPGGEAGTVMVDDEATTMGLGGRAFSNRSMK